MFCSRSIPCTVFNYLYLVMKKKKTKELDKIKILYEDNHLIAVNKPGGWLVQGDKTGDKPLSDFVKEYIKKRYKKPGDVFLGVIHRLDRPVSGVVIYARTSKGLERMNKLFRDQEIHKSYRAITAIRPNPIKGTLEHYLLKDHEKNITKAFDRLGRRSKDAKKSILHYEMLARIGSHHLIKINPITGRPHQIRVQLSRLGCPIRGDIKYGYQHANKDATIHLHCRSMSFVHPVKKEEMTIIADFPKDQVWNEFGGLFD